MEFQIHSVFAKKSLVMKKKSITSTELLGDIKHHMSLFTFHKHQGVPGSLVRNRLPMDASREMGTSGMLR